jgi:hypothetical protein
VTQLTTSSPQQQINMPAVDLRQFLGTLISSQGVRLTNDLQVAQRASGANMSVDVAAGQCVIADSHASGGGFYHYAQAVTTNVAITAADPTNPRRAAAARRRRCRGPHRAHGCAARRDPGSRPSIARS